MGLVTYAYYTQTYMGEPVSWTDFPRYDARAEDLILGLIKKTEAQAEALAAPVLLLVRKAICAQIEYLNEYGIGVAVYGKEAGDGFTVGKVSIRESRRESNVTDTGARSMIAPAVYVYLEQTGLLYPGVQTFGMPSQAWGWWP